jgi:radical SAM protein with 4Fe4S-binding SPASM domain
MDKTQKSINQENIMYKMRYITNNFKETFQYMANRKSLRKAIDKYKRNGIPSIGNIQRIGLKLTNACNLRCTMCFQWKKDKGLHNSLPKDELRLYKCQNLISFLEKYHAEFFLWGGEPLMSSEFDSFVEEICKHGNFCTICTNGILLDKYMNVFEKYHKKIKFIVSLDGPEYINDSIRGKGCYQKTVDNIKELVRRKKTGKKWIISTETTIMPENLEVLKETVELCEDLGIDLLILNHLWVIPKKAREEYIDFCNKMGYNLPRSIEGYDYPSFDTSYIDKMISQLDSIKQGKRKKPIKFMPPFSYETLRKYYNGEKIEDTNPCYKHGIKIDVLANGDVVACKQFPDVVLGNIYENKLGEILSSDRYLKVSKYFHQNGLNLCYSCPEYYNLRI